jgi:hypothetical protein
MPLWKEIIKCWESSFNTGEKILPWLWEHHLFVFSRRLNIFLTYESNISEQSQGKDILTVYFSNLVINFWVYEVFLFCNLISNLKCS